MDNKPEYSKSCELSRWMAEDFDAMRKARSELETKWNKNFDAYNNCDDVTKKKWKAGEGNDWRSRSYIGITRQKVQAVLALILDMTLRGGKIPMMLKRERSLEEPEPTPVVSMAPSVEGAEMPSMPVATPQKDVGAGGMERLIKSQQEVCRADITYKKCVLSGAVFGEGWSKRGVTEVKRGQHVNTGRGWAYSVEARKMPSVSYLSVWDMFRDLETDDLSECFGIAHRQMLSASDLRAMMGNEVSGYIPDAIQDVLNKIESSSGVEGVEMKTIPAGMGIKEVFGGEEWNRGNGGGLSPALRDIKSRKRHIEVVERWGRVPRKIVEAFESGRDVKDFTGDDDTDAGDEVECVCTLASDTIIRFARTSVEDRPFSYFVLEMALDGVSGVGIPDKIEHEQYVLNGSIRAFEDNLRLAGDVMMAVKRRYLVDQDKLQMRPGGVVDLDETCQDARQAIQQIVIQNVGAAYQEIIALIERYAEESSMIPRITQGASPIYNKTTTLGEINQQTDKAGKYIATIIQNIDDGLIEPWGRYFLEYNMEDPTVPDDVKGSYYVVPLGFTSYEDKVLKFDSVMKFLSIAQTMPQLLSQVRMDTFTKLIAELLDLDEDELLKTPEQIEAEMAAEAQRRQEDAMERASMEKTMAQAEKIKVDAQAKAAKVGHDQQRIDHESERIKIERARAVGELQKNAISAREAEKSSSAG